MSKRGTTLVIAESLQEDIDKGIARIPSRILQEFDLHSGDLIEIRAKNVLVLRALRSSGRDESKNTIRIDGTARANLGASIGDSITIAPISLKMAQSITLAPLQEVRFS